tara:strand:+ start:47 stop:445 length:399 start_codon:yes stop_codon:yes gene_type:complete
MKKLLAIIVLGLFLTSCTKGLSTGKREWFPRGSLGWYDWTPKEDIIAWENLRIYKISKMELYDVCMKWDEYYYDSWSSRNYRRLISKGLVKKGEDGLYCRNPSQDRVRRAEDEVEKAKQRAEEEERRRRLKK